MKTYTFSGETTCTQRFTYKITVTAEEISRKNFMDGEYSVADIEAMTEEQIREHMMEEKWWLDELSHTGEECELSYEYVADDDFEMEIGEEE